MIFNENTLSKEERTYKRKFHNFNTFELRGHKKVQHHPNMRCKRFVSSHDFVFMYLNCLNPSFNFSTAGIAFEDALAMNDGSGIILNNIDSTGGDAFDITNDGGGD